MKAQKKNAPVGGNRTRGRAIKSNTSLMDFGEVVKTPLLGGDKSVYMCEL